MNENSPYKNFLDGIKLFNYTSQFGEDAILHAIFNKIGITNRWCLECGAADGLFFSNTRRLIEDGWNSIQIETDENLYKELIKLYQDNVNIRCIYEEVSLHHGRRLDDILNVCEAPKDIDLVVIDVDGQDFWIWNSLLHYRPRVVMVEHNPNNLGCALPIPGELDETKQAGLNGLAYIAAAKGYEIICCTQVNMICVARELAEELKDVRTHV